MSEPIVISECPTCHRVSDGEASDAHCAGAMYDGSAHDSVAMVRLRVFREQDIRLTEDESNGLHSALNAAAWHGVLNGPRVDALRARVDAGFVDGPSWEEVRLLWEALRGTTDDRLQALHAFPAPEVWTEPDEDPEPSDDQLANGHNMEGGVAYSDPRMLPLEDRPL